MRLLSQGEKVRKLRLDLGLKKEDIANDKVSKSLISMIEKGRRGLTFQTAIIIANSLNKYYINIGKEITPEYLMETELDNAKKEIIKEKRYLQSAIDSCNIEVKLVSAVFDKLFKLAEDWELKKEKMELLVLKGNYYYKTFQYNDGLKSLSSALEFYIEEKNNSEVARVYILIGACYHMQLNLDRALNYYTKAYHSSVEQNTTNKARVFNIITSVYFFCRQHWPVFDIYYQYVIS